MPGQILVQPKSDLSETEFATKLNLRNGHASVSIPRLNIRLVTVPEDNAEALLAQLRRDPKIEFAERDYFAEAAFTPNDPRVLNGDQWHLATIHAPEAWDSSTGDASTIVAVLDSGVNAAHPDLTARLVAGYDFVWGDSDPADDFGHGTAVAGVVVAAGNNGIGVAGVAFNARVMPIKVMNSSGFAAYSAIAQGVRFAVDNGARIVNISLAGTSPSATLQDAINYAWRNNVTVVAAAGNNGNDTPLYPAACTNVVAVSATMQDDSLATFSSHGGHIALAAPGGSIWTTSRDSATGYSAWSGTSFASPIVAGVAALVASVKPTLTSRQIVSILEQSAEDFGATGHDPLFGSGRVNAVRAVHAAQSADLGAPVASVVSPAPGDGVSGQVNVEVVATGSAPVLETECYADGTLIGSSPGPNGTFVWLTSALTNGTYTLQARATDVAGNVGYSTSVVVHVANALAMPTTITGLVPTEHGTLLLTWDANPNRSYRVQCTTNLLAPNWQDCSDEVTAISADASTALPIPNTPQCFYRIRSLP